MSEMAESVEAARRRGGRPRSGPIGLLPPEIVPMTAAQLETAIQSLAVLLGSWLEERTHRSKAVRARDKPKAL